MSWLTKTVVFALALAVCAGCGSSTEQGVPTPTDPNATPSATPTPAPSPTPDPRLPDLSKSVPIALVDNTNYSGIEDMTGTTVFPPLVGDARVKLALTANSSQSYDGLLRFAFEDKKGLWWTDLQTFDNTAYVDANNFDVIFQDDSVVMRIYAQRSGDALNNGKYYYRKHLSTDTACRKEVFMCGSSPCAQQPDLVTPCRAYMDPSHAEVKLLGTFTGSLSDWLSR